MSESSNHIPVTKLIKWIKKWRKNVTEESSGLTYRDWDYLNNEFTVVVVQHKGRVLLYAAYAPVELLAKVECFRKRLLEANHTSVSASFSEFEGRIYARADFLVTANDQADKRALWDCIVAIKSLMNRLSGDLGMSLGTDKS